MILTREFQLALSWPMTTVWPLQYNLIVCGITAVSLALIIYLLNRHLTMYDITALGFRSFFSDIEDTSGTIPAHIWAVVHELRSELGLLGHTKANALVVSNRARAIMRSRDMRVADVSIHHPVVVAVYFMRSPADEYLEKVVASRSYRQMDRAGAPY